jgi:hypothetical protein
VYSFDNPKAKETHTTQYFEMFGNRGIYHDGWTASTRHSIPWLLVQNPPLTSDVWELYNVANDFSQAHDLAAKNPAKLKELQDLFMEEAVKNHVLPIDDRRSERFSPVIAGRPDLMGDRTSLTVYPGMVGINENAFIGVKNRSYDVTASVDLADSNAHGVIIAQAGRFGGWTLYMKDGRAHHEYNFFGVERTNIASEKPLGPGKHEIRYAFHSDGPKPGTGGRSELYVDGQLVATAQLPKTQPFAFSGDEGVDVGADLETAVSNDYAQGNNAFSGRIEHVTVNVAPMAPAPAEAATTARSDPD